MGQSTITEREAAGALAVAVSSVVDSFTQADGSFTPDDLTQTEWEQLKDALELYRSACSPTNESESSDG
jgi:hypothetical protein